MKSAMKLVLAGVAASVSGSALGVGLGVSGQAALVGDYFNGIPPGQGIYQAWRAPLGLTLEARPTNNLAMYLDLRLGYNAYPSLARELGNSQGSHDKAQQPFTVNGGRGEHFDTPRVGFGFVEYAAPEIGLFKVGRMPRHWGLGLWRHDGGVDPSVVGRDWQFEGGTSSTSDGVSATFDFRTLYFSAYWEKNAEGDPMARGDDAEAWSVDLVVADSLTEASESGFGREVGIAFSRYSDSLTSTRLNVLDIYSRLYYGSMLFEGELLYPNGSTGSGQYADLGGPTVCPDDASKIKNGESCGRTTIDAVSGLFRTRWQFSSSVADARISSADAASRRAVPTQKKRESHSAGLWFGYAGGDANAFAPSKDSPKATTGVMHPNIRPSLLMFSTVAPATPGMPGGQVRNALFARGEYTYDSPVAGSFTPAIIWGTLRATRPADSGKSLAQTEGVGRYSDLGVEFNLGYSYVTGDFLKLGADAGYWMPGKAWSKSGSSKPSDCFGARLSVSTTFH